jgi:glycosyltransferase involved in cell wall biosynthesis
MGGGDKYVLMLAKVLSEMPGISVTLLSDKKQITKSELGSFFHVNLSNVHYRHFHGGSHEIKNLARDVDLFICLSNYQKFQVPARASIQLLQIPYGRINTRTMTGRLLKGEVKETIKDCYRLGLLFYAKNTANGVVTNSGFVRDTLSRHFGIHSEVLYPPINDFLLEGMSKKNIILSVGRFFHGLYNDKRYDILTEAFRSVCRTELQDWEFHIVGSATSDSSTQKMLHSLKDRNRDSPIYFHVNEPYHSLQRFYNEATIFWHAAGYEVDEELHPENVEHFGMATVEAMSAGCIPVVIRKGGQKEIILDTVNGFSWSTIDELIGHSVEIARGGVPLAEIRQNARKRFEDFNFERFRQRAVELFSPFFS